jgi:hypothetical protein
VGPSVRADNKAKNASSLLLVIAGFLGVRGIGSIDRTRSSYAMTYFEYLNLPKVTFGVVYCKKRRVLRLLARSKR